MPLTMILTEINVWLNANRECKRVKTELANLNKSLLFGISQELSYKERLHLRHTTFRINALMYLYSKLVGLKHETRIGALCGAITHLLDYFYDQCAPSSEEVTRIENIIFAKEEPNNDDLLKSTLYELSRSLWDHVSNPEVVKSTLQNMLTTQGASIIQNDIHTEIHSDQMNSLTLLKGHHSLCLYFSILNPMFSEEEAKHLTLFGHYMQYMDDLEDYYEDQAENRISSVQSIDIGANESTRLLMKAQPQLAEFYDYPHYQYGFVWNKVLFYHHAMLLACRMRELTRRLPKSLQKIIIYSKEVVSYLIPFIYVAPVDWIE